MLHLRDLFQWDRFVAPAIIRVFYGLTVAVTLAFGVSTLATAVGLARLNPLAGAFMAIAAVVGMLLVILLTRILCEFVLVTFRINDHLGALRARAEQ